MENKSKNGPEKRISAGAISVTVWKNEGKLQNGATNEFNTISIQRNYQDPQGNWKSTTSMRVNDLPKAALALNKAFEYLTLKDAAAEQQSI